jgi:hypothetical protein
MKNHENLLWKIDTALAFVDLKVGLLIWIMVDLYRSTMILDYVPGVKLKNLAEAFQFIWERNGSPYVIWIPIVGFADVALKRVVKGMME